MLFKLNLLLFSFVFLQINCSFYDLNYIRLFKKDNLMNEMIMQLITLVMKSALQLKQIPNITQNCLDKLERSFFIMDKSIYDKEEELLAKYYYNKLLLDSSTNINDLSSYPNCIHSDHEYDFSKSKEGNRPSEPLYITIFLDHRKEQLEFFRNNKSTTSFLIGICFIEGCNNNDIKLLTGKVMNLLNLTKINETLEIYTLNDKYEKKNFLKFIPIFIFALHIFIALFHKFFAYIFRKIKKLCRPKKGMKIIPKFGNDDTNNSVNNSFVGKLTKKKNNQNFQKFANALFNVENNFNFLLNSESKNEIHNDNSLSYMNGIKGISMITLIFGYVFVDFYNAPIIKKSLDNFYEIVSHPSFFIFYFGIKYAPKLLLCSSGFSLFFKFMCFLDDKTEKEEELKEVNLEEEKFEQQITQNDTNNNKSNNNSITMNNKNNNSINKDNERKNRSADNIIHRKSNKKLTKEEDQKKEYSSLKNSKKKEKGKKINKYITWKYYFWFLTNQVNKYILYLFIIFLILFSLYDTVVFFVGKGPLWNLFKVKIISTSLKSESLIPGIFAFQFSFISQYKYDTDSLFAYFNLVYQEILFFILSTLIIFIGYKHNLRIDRFILVIIFLLFAFRIFYYYLFGDELNVRDYFDLKNYGYFYNSPIFNYLYYSLGIYLGSLNYVIQKGYTYSECENQNKMYLLGFTRLLKILSRKSKLVFYILGIVFLFLIIGFSFTQFFLYEYYKLQETEEEIIHSYSSILSNYNKNILTSIIMMFDTDIVVLSVNLMALLFYLKGDNVINDFLNLNFFTIFNKIYFSFLLMINPIIFYVFYNAESKINFNMQNCYLYSFSCGILIFIFSIFIYGLFELPYKKVFKLLLKNCEVQVEEKRMDLIEKQIFNYKKEEDKIDSELQSENSNDNEEKPFIVDDE